MTGYKYLKWDSIFFKVNVFSLEDTGSVEDLNKILSYLYHEEKANLIYLKSARLLKLNSLACPFFFTELVDEKLTFCKTIKAETRISEAVMPYAKSFADETILRLAIQSGLYSRFNVDKRISYQKYEEMYSTWIQKSIRKENAIEVLVYMNGQDLAGMITLSEKGKVGIIGLLAVDAKYRGKGIGKELIIAAENWFAQNGYSEIQVVTQRDNKPACSLYSKLDFKIQNAEFIYHMWDINK